MEGGGRNLTDLRPGESAIISGFSDESLSTKLIEMGFLPGAPVTFNFKAPLGDPICVTVLGYELALRLEEASTITIIN